MSKYLQVEKTGDTLKIGLEQNRLYGGSTLQAEVTMPALIGLEVGGGSQVTVNASGTLNVDASGGSQVDYLGSPTLGQIDASGGSNVDPR